MYSMDSFIYRWKGIEVRIMRGIFVSFLYILISVGFSLQRVWGRKWILLIKSFRDFF